MLTFTEIGEKARPVFNAYGVRNASVFGSVARGDARPDSDIDILIELERPIGVFRLVGLKQELEKTLGYSVDVVVREALNRHTAPFIEADLLPLAL